MSEDIQFDPNSVTLGEMLAAERASGMDMAELLRTTSGRLLLGVFCQRFRNSGTAPTWKEIQNLRVLDASSSLSGSGPDNPGPK